MKLNRSVLLGCGALFIMANCFAIMKQFFYVPLLSGAAIILYLLVFRVDLLMYLLALATPFSIVIADDKINIGLSLPSEIIMILITLLFICRIIYDMSLERKLITHPVSIAVYVYLIWMFITCITSELPVVSFKFWASKIWFITSCYFMVIQLIKNDLKNAVTFFNCYAIGLAVVVVITTVKHALQGFSEHVSHWVMSPFYNDHTAYGAILAF
ncbi:MAG: hypothetical protein RR034_03235, partial [Bacteroidales bacterium]